MICVDLAFNVDDHEKLEIYDGDDLKVMIERMCDKRGIKEETLKNKIREIVELQVQKIVLPMAQ